MAKVFVSYARKDSVAARKVIQALADMGQDIWVDWEDIPPAADWMEQILLGIERVDAFLFMVSPHSAISEVCKVEINHAAKNNKRIIPIVLESVQPADTIDIIRKLNWIFLQETDEGFKTCLERIKTAIELDFDWVAEHSRLQSRALEWERRKEASLLLRGRDLWSVRQRLQAVETKDPKPTDLQKIYVLHSNRNERRNFIIYMLASFAIIIMAVLSYTAFTQRNEAIKNRAIADQKAAEAETNRLIAEKKSREAEASAKKAETNARKAIKEKQAAEKAQQRAEESRKLADAQRSTALAQIYQIKPGELFTSTLLAINSWQTEPSDSAEEILRKNISLLPLPVAQLNHADQINTITLNTTGDIFVTAGADGMVCAWQVADGAKLFCANSAGAVTDAVISPDGETLIAGDGLGNLLFIDLRDGTSQTPIPAFASPITDLDMQGGRDPRFVAVTTKDGTITIVNWKTRQRSGTDLKASSLSHFAVFSPNGLQIATGSQDGTITIWSLNQLRNSITTRKHRGEIITLEFSPDSRYLVSGGADGAAVVLDAKTGGEVYRSLHSDQVRDIAFSRDSKRFVTVSKDRYVRVWDADTGKQLLIMSQSNAIQMVKLTEDGRWVATTGDDKTVRLWNAITGTEMLQIPIKGNGTALAFSKDDQYLITGDQLGYATLWDISQAPAPDRILQFDGVTTSALFSPAGNWIAASDDKKVWLLNPKTLPTLSTRPPGSTILNLRSNVSRMVFSSKDRWLGMLNVGNEIVLRNTQNSSGRTISPANRVTGIAFSPDEKNLLTTDTEGHLQVWDVSTGKLVDTPVKYDQPITALAGISNQLAVGQKDTVHILDASTLAELEQPQSNYDIELLAFSADGTLLASGNASGQIQIWKKEGGKFGLPSSITKGNIISLAFTPANNLLAIGLVDSLLLMDPATREEYARVPVTGTVNSISFAADGTTFLTSSLRVLQFWDLTKIQKVQMAGIVQRACNHLLENLSYDQWDLLFKEDEYRPLCENLQPAP